MTRKIKFAAAVLAVLAPLGVVAAPAVFDGFATFIKGRAAPSALTGAEVVPLMQGGATTGLPLLSLLSYVAGNLTPAQIGAVGTSGAAMTGALGVPSIVVSGSQGLLGGYNGSNTGIPFGLTTGAGYGRLVPGDTTHPGYVEFDAASGVRTGYAGWNDGLGDLQLSGPWVLDTPPAAGDTSLRIANTSFVGTAVGSLKTYLLGLLQQSYTLQVPSAAALRNLVGFSGVVVTRSGYAAPADGGAATYVFNAAACGTDDGGSCLNASGGGSWRIDWASVVRSAASPCLFENCQTATDDTAAIKAAVATGRTTYLPALSRSYVVSSDIPQGTPNQIIYGDGRGRSNIQVNSAAGFSNGVIVETASPGPVLRDFSISFAQANATSASGVVQYVPAIFMQGVNGGQMDRLGLYLCWVCIDARGNTGATTIRSLEFNAFSKGVWVDEALDTFRLVDPRWFPINMPSTAVYNWYMQEPGSSGAPNQIALYIGRADDLKLYGGLFVGGTYLDVHKSTVNTNDPVGATVQISTTQFDSYPALNLSYGTVNIANVRATILIQNNVTPTAFVNSGGTLTIASSDIIVNSNGNGTTSAPGGGGVAAQGGMTMLDNIEWDIGSSDAPYVVQTGGHLSIMGNEFVRNTNIAYPNNPVINLQAGDTVAIGNHITGAGSGSGRFMYVGNDNGANKIWLNTAPSYPSYVPSNPVAAISYGGNS